jgi:hypothetical protein
LIRGNVKFPQFQSSLPQIPELVYIVWRGEEGTRVNI